MVGTEICMPIKVNASMPLQWLLEDSCEEESVKDATSQTFIKNCLQALRYAQQKQWPLGRTDIPVVADTGGSKVHVVRGVIPTITATRGESRDFVVLNQGCRRVTLTELARCQGFADGTFNFSAILSARQWGKALGNAVTMPVAQAVVEAVLKSP